MPGPGTLSAANAQVLTRGYDSVGNLIEIGAPGIIGAPEIHTTIHYDSLPGVSGPGPYPTRVVYAPGTALARTWSYDWDDASGWLKSSTDVDNALTTEYTYDALGRPRTVTEAGERKTAIAYDDRNRRVTTSSDLFTLGDGKLQTIAQHDMLGRVVETRVSDGPSLSTSDGIEVTTDYIHTSGAPLKVVTSAPYRPPADATLEWTCTQFDRLARPCSDRRVQGIDAAIELRRHREPDRPDRDRIHRRSNHDHGSGRKEARRVPRRPGTSGTGDRGSRRRSEIELRHLVQL